MPLRRVPPPPVDKPVLPSGASASDAPVIQRRHRRVFQADGGPKPTGEELAISNTAPHPASNYEVGYGKPPKHSRFKPGRSGNPKGRPKGARGLNQIVRENLTEKVQVRTATGARKIRRVEAIVMRQVEQALQGNPRAVAAMLAAYAAAVPEHVDIDAHHGEAPLTETDQAILAYFADQIAHKGDRS